jgi:hypothetical protein
MFKNGSIVTLADPFQIRSNISVSVKVFGTNYTKIAYKI